METPSTAKVKFGVALCKEERIKAIHYIQSIMRQNFECEPPPTTGLICIATQDKSIVGSIVLQGSTERQLFPIERNYAFDNENTKFNGAASRIVQGSRWTAIKPGISLMLLRGSFALAHELGMRHMLIEAKPYSVNRLRGLGLTCIEVPGAVLSQEKIQENLHENMLPYYTTPPYPGLYTMELAQLL